MALTLEDIARLSGFSRSTISRVINGDQKVREDTRLKVMEIIQEHNFQPNIAARRLAAGKTNVIGMVITTGVGNIYSDPYFSKLIQGITSECTANEYSAMLWLIEPESERQTIRQIINNGIIDGIVVSSSLINDPIVNSLSESQIPLVMIGHNPLIPINSIDIDNTQAAYTICSHLLTCTGKRKRPATITGPQKTLAGRDRLAGFLSAVQDANLIMDPALIAEGDFSESSGYSAMKKLIPFKPDSVFAANDIMAAGAIRATREAGLKIPYDLAIIGFDDVTLASQLDPPLTTVRQPILNMGALAVNLLIQTIKNTETEPRQIILPYEIVIRLSCGCKHTI